jgi:hypothetical protein
MVEHKHCLYDEANPPMVHATFADDDDDDEMMNARETLLSVTAEPSAPAEDLDNNNDPPRTRPRQPTPPPSIRDVVVNTPLNTPPPAPRDFTPADNQGGPIISALTTTSQQMRDPEHDRMVASGTAGAVIGLLIGGPFLAAFAGFGSAYATQKDGAAGDTARALGDVALTVKEKARDLNAKHHIVDKFKKVAGETWEKAQELDRNHHILEQLKALLIFSWEALIDFVRRRRLLEKGVDGVGRGIEYIAGKVSGTQGTHENSTSQTNNERRSERRQM